MQNYLSEYDLNLIELLRCYQIPFDQNYELLSLDLDAVCNLLDRVSEQVCEQIRANYHHDMMLFECSVGTDLYISDHLIQTKELAASIAKKFQREDYLLLIENPDNFRPQLFRKFLYDFFARRKISLPTAYNTHQMEVEFECLQTMLSLCKMSLRSRFIRRYKSWFHDIYFNQKKQRKRC